VSEELELDFRMRIRLELSGIKIFESALREISESEEKVICFIKNHPTAPSN
jgi:hypothetical protein